MNLVLPEFIHDFASCKRCYATLCIYHPIISPDEVSKILLVQPSRQKKVGEKLRGDETIQINGWFLCTRGQINSRDIRAHIWNLIENLGEKNNALKRIADLGHEIKISCYWESASGNGGPLLDTKTMAALSLLQIELEFDIWLPSN